MRTSTFLNFLFLLIYKHKSKHIAISLISILIVFLISSVLFISSSIQKEVFNTLDAQSDFVVQRINSGKIVNTPNSWIDDFSDINGISNIQQRVYGQYYFESANKYFTIVGVDLFEESTNKDIKELLKILNIQEFMKKNSMIIGNGVEKILREFKYFEYYFFRLQNRDTRKVSIFKALPKETNIIANDLIIMDISLAKEILNIGEDQSTDIVLNVPNELEQSNIKIELILKHLDIRVIQKSDIKKAYENLYNYKGGIFLILFIIVMITFVLILFQRYTMISSSDKKEIGILRAVGWSIKDVIKLKISETFIIAFISFLIGVIIAYMYVFFLNAPILSNIFLGFGNLENSVSFSPNIDFSTIVTLFLFFIIPFISAVLIPTWKIAVIEPSESMK